MSVEIALKQNILVTDFHLLKSLLVVLGFGSQAFVCGFSSLKMTVFIITQARLQQGVGKLDAAICVRFLYINIARALVNLILPSGWRKPF